MKVKSPAPIARVHSLSPEMSRQLTVWIENATNEVAQAISVMSKKLEELYRSQQRTQIELRQVPVEEVIRPIMEELNLLNEDLGRSTSDVERNEKCLVAL